MMFGLAGQLTQLARMEPDLVPIHVKKAGQPDEPVGQQWMRALCVKVSGQSKTSALTSQQAVEVTRELEQAIARLKEQLSGVAQPREESTVAPEQQAYVEKLLGAIAQLRGTYQQMAKDKTRWRKWCQHYLGTPWPQTQKDADVAIEALKSMLSRELPTREVLVGELKSLEGRTDLPKFGQELVADGLKRSKRWGPYQWFKLHQIYLNHKGQAHEEG